MQDRELSVCQRREKKMLGYIILCWSTVLSALVDQFVLIPWLWGMRGWFPILVLIVPPTTFFLIKDSHLKVK